MIGRRRFLQAAIGSATALTLTRLGHAEPPAPGGVSLPDVLPDEDLFGYLERQHGRFDRGDYLRILGAANPFKEGDQIVGVAAADEASRHRARELLQRTRLADLDAHPLLEDQLSRLLQQSRDAAAAQRTATWTLAELKRFLLSQDPAAIEQVRGGLSSEVIGCVVKLMSNEELISLGAKLFHPLAGSSRIGAKGYLGARIQPNSPTDNPLDIRWQVLDGWAYAVGDVLLGTNPVSSEPQSVLAVEHTLRELLETFGLTEVMPHCVLAHIDVQAEVERLEPGSTALWFQSIAGSDSANQTFDISVAKMLDYAAQRRGQYGLYFETGQGADFTNGHSHGFDMVLHESRKYGFARALQQEVARAQLRHGRAAAPWVHVNDVAGFIGPEVFRTREQLVRCCLEDIAMGKLHGLTIGLDVCSTLHMDVTLDDLDWCLDQIMPANPAYLMALPTKIDPMLGYLTTGYQDHVRLRAKFGYRVNDPMAEFFQRLGVIDSQGQPTEHFGNPLWVFLQYQRLRGDSRPDREILEQGRAEMADVRGRGVFLAEGQGNQPGELAPPLDTAIRQIYRDAKECLWKELQPAFVAQIPAAVTLRTESRDRQDYILHPETGERLTDLSRESLLALRRRSVDRHNVQIVISDGLNALAISDQGHLEPFLAELRAGLVREGWRPAPDHLVINSGRVRAGYRIGELLFAERQDRCSILHMIGERPGTGHHTFSVYITSLPGANWSEAGGVDHNHTRVVSGAATTALAPVEAAQMVVRMLKS